MLLGEWYTTVSVKLEQDFLFMVFSQFAPQWLLGSRRFTNRLHSNLDIEVPKEVVNTFSAGLKYISPIAIKKSIVKELWNEFCTQALRSWDNSHLYELQEKDDSSNPFYSIPVPFKLTGLVKPYEGKPNESILCILDRKSVV